jgi:predicted  nucleic acid-binding Zn-ribbon protein
VSDIYEAVRNGWLHKDAEDEIKRLRAERDALAKENAALRTLLAECRPSMVEHRKRVEQDLTNAAYFPGRYPETLKALNTERDICDALLDRIGAAVQR